MELEQIQDFDMVYIYHHLKIGTELSFNNGSVYFKNFKLGLLKIDSMYYDRVGMVKIESIEKDKFLPPTKISVVVEMKMQLIKTNKMKLEQVIQSASEKLSRKLDDIIIEGLRLKGFDFNTVEELESFIKNRCHCKIEWGKGWVYYIDQEPFLFHTYGLNVKSEFDSNSTEFKIDSGRYKFL